ncbi:hypothetical protein DHEL01_v211113 [Diaporthe helianthi]|uniref:Uncharacterized protein n=1 Tax=Diaporthe helianthi TaxID=158607 RepID=A0A2P5HJQ5_DIAHE|nr:hypothetical protein DHEL01_v211113 [Diaporthe helianthi]
MAADLQTQASFRDWARRTQDAVARTVRQLFPGLGGDPDDPGRVMSEWRRARNHVPFIPEWTDPEWSPTVQFSPMGTRKRDIYVTTGEVMRPAILPRDADKNPTDFARRFGIYPKTRPDDNDPAVGRSLVTPTTSSIGQGAAGVFTLGEAEAWQSYVFNGPTAKEMIDHRIYVPGYESNEPGLEGDLHPLLAREKWLRPSQDRLTGNVNNFRWRFGDSEGDYNPDHTLGAQGITFSSGLFNPDGRNDRIGILINPSIVWQLMTTEFPEVRIATTFHLADIILHELAAKLWDRKQQLNRVKASSSRIVHNLWGVIPHIGINHGYNPGELTTLRPFINALSWPTSHLAVDLQHEDVDRSFYAPYATGDYSGFLLNPPAPVFDQSRPIPIDHYAQFFHESFWQNQFTRFGHQALKLVPSQDALMNLLPRGNRLVNFEIRRELSAEDYHYFSETLLPLLKSLQQYLLVDWLVLETNSLVLEQVTHHRLHYEARTWIKTYGDIISLLDKSIADINQVGGEMTLRISHGRQGWLTVALQQTIMTNLQQNVTNFVTDDLLEVDRLLRNSIQYGQSVIAMYSLLPQPSQRQAVHRNHMIPLRGHLTSVRNKLTVFIQNLQGFITAAAAVRPFGPDSQSFLAPVVTTLTDYVGPAVQAAQVNLANLARTIALLADDLVAPGLDYSAHPHALPHVPLARKHVTQRDLYRRAAARALAYLNSMDRNRAAIGVQKWLAVLARIRGEKEGALEAYPVDINVDSPGSGSQAPSSSSPSGSSPSGSSRSGSYAIGSSPRIPGGFPRSPGRA